MTQGGKARVGGLTVAAPTPPRRIRPRRRKAERGAARVSWALDRVEAGSMLRKRRYELGAAAALLVLVSGMGGVLLYRRYLDHQLVAAVDQGDPSAVKALLDKGANVNTREDNFGSRWPVLAVAADRGSVETMRLLLNRGAKVNARVLNGGDTALTQAAFHGHSTCVQLLLQYGADIDARNGAGASALMNAAQQGHAETVAILLKAGADAKPKGLLGRTALRLAKGAQFLTSRHQERAEVVRLLQAAGAPE
jgi:hypothetical protein